MNNAIEADETHFLMHGSRTLASPEPFFDIERVVPVYANSGFHFATSWIRECMDGGNVRTNSNTTHHPTVDVSESIRGTELFPHIAVDARVSRRVRIISARLKVQIGLVAVDVDHVSISIHHSPEGLEKKRKDVARCQSCAGTNTIRNGRGKISHQVGRVIAVDRVRQ